METVFRFVFARPGIPAENAVRVQVERPSPFQNELIDARAGANARTQMLAIAAKYAGTPGIARDYGSYTYGTPWSELEAYLEKAPKANVSDVKGKIQQFFGSAPEKLV